jgi:hypothetical protein
MNDKFLYRNASEIKKLFAKHHVLRCQIQWAGLYACLYLDQGTDPDLASSREIDLKYDLWKLAHDDNSLPNFNFLSYDLAAGSLDSIKPIDFDVYLGRGLLQMAHKGYIPEFEGLIAAGVNPNYRDSDRNKTSLQLAFSGLAEAYEIHETTDDNDLKKFAPENMQALKEIVRLLLKHPNIIINRNNDQEMNLASYFIEQLPIQDPQKTLAENTTQLQVIIADVLLLLQEKGVVVDANKLLQKGYPLISQRFRTQAEPPAPIVTTHETTEQSLAAALSRLGTLANKQTRTVASNGHETPHHQNGSVTSGNTNGSVTLDDTKRSPKKM